MPMRSRLTNTPATRPRSAGRPVSFSTMEASTSASSGDFSGVSGARWPRPRPGALQGAVGAAQHRQVADAAAVGIGVGEEAAFGGTPAAPRPASAARRSAGDGGLQVGRGLASAARTWPRSSPRSSAASPASRRPAPACPAGCAAWCRCRSRSCRRGCDARLPRPAEPLVQLPARSARRRRPSPGRCRAACAGLDRQFDRSARPGQRAEPPPHTGGQAAIASQQQIKRRAMASARPPLPPCRMGADDNGA
jgi:hypothetical protein